AGARAVAAPVARGPRGVWNLAHPGETSWEGFAAECRGELARRGFALVCQEMEFVPYEFLLRSPSGKRPAYSVLDVGKIQGVLKEPLVDWKEGLRNFLDCWLKANPEYADRF
ncbi:MAG: NAD(P)-dependent oxidoreductase, partial [Chthoniobacterales bacterium]|nr:NAD(P)-dependent oxidoreductase [Chthoniobacterales bacterium]